MQGQFIENFLGQIKKRLKSLLDKDYGRFCRFNKAPRRGGQKGKEG